MFTLRQLVQIICRAITNVKEIDIDFELVYHNFKMDRLPIKDGFIQTQDWHEDDEVALTEDIVDCMAGDYGEIDGDCYEIAIDALQDLREQCK